MAERMREVVAHRLGHARRSGGEVDQHDVLAGHALLPRRTLELVAFVGDQLVEGMPAFAFARDDDLILDGRRFGQRLLGLFDDVGVVDAHHHLDLGACGAIDDVLLRQLKGRGDDRGSQLMQGDRAHPVLPAAAQDHHDDIALADAEPAERVGGLVGELRDVRERERALGAMVVAPHERALLRLDASPFVHDIEAEVERLGHLDAEVLVKVLVRVELDTRAVFLQNVIHNIPFQER